jgi:glycosyltransferase involved in cell wall biosynthesis
MKVIYIAQFHETCGYSHAALGYLKAINSEISKVKNLELKILSVSFDSKKLTPDFHKSKTDADTFSLLHQYHFEDQNELDNFLQEDYICIWHMTSVMPVILKRPSVGSYYNSLNADVDNIIVGSQDNYHILAWETDELPQEYKTAINTYKPRKVITPSQWNTDTVQKFTSAETIPHVIEECTGHTEGVKLPFDPETNFVVLSISEWNQRKNFQSTIRAFMLELGDKDDAYLVIKTSIPEGMSKEEFLREFSVIKSSVRSVRKNQNIIIVLSYLSREKMKYLYKSADIFCLTSFGEGFSLPLSEAVKNGTPVLCPDEGGHVDYLDASGPYLINGHWDTVFGPPPYDSDGKWYIPSVASVRDKMSESYNDWTLDNGRLQKSASDNLKVVNEGPFSLIEVGKSLCKTLIETLPRHKKKITRLKKEIQNKTLKQQVELLKDKYKDQECYILNCGPSLKELDENKLKEFLKDKLVLSVKQAGEVFSDVTDFHFFNCSNLPNVEPSQPPYEDSEEVVSIASSNYAEYTRWSLLQRCDLFFKIPIRTEINNEFLVRTGEIDNFLLKNNLTRPCGPGIMYETVLFTALHLGVKSITCIGWDLTMDQVKEDDYQHFYGSTEGLLNRGDILDWEIRETREFSKVFHEWCIKNNIELKISSTQSTLCEKIPRITLEL